MIKRSLLLENKASVTTKDLQLIIKTKLRETSIPIEDIGYLLLDHPEIYISLPSLNLLIENNAAIIICNHKHLPNGLFLNLNSHHIQQELFKHQINASLPLKKQLWQQTIKQKILNQGNLLERLNGAKNQFPYLASKVLSGDSSNMEAVAANAYWKLLFDSGFRRGRYGDYPNNLLNYGYAILRAAVARSLSISGMLNTLGIHHRNKYNAFALADDMMEVFRPIVDEKVFEMMEVYPEENLHTQMKADLLQILTRTVYFDGEKSLLMVGLQKTASSLQQCFKGDLKKIKYPQLWN